MSDAAPSVTVWSLLLKVTRQYGGNTGYADELATSYHFDSEVGNGRHVAAGDTVVLRNSDKVLGVARVQQIDLSPEIKLRRRCPSCQSANIKARTTTRPYWRCQKCGHVFDDPIEEQLLVTGYRLRYGLSYRSAGGRLPIDAMASAYQDKSGQSSIRRLDGAIARELLTAAGLWPAA